MELQGGTEDGDDFIMQKKEYYRAGGLGLVKQRS